MSLPPQPRAVITGAASGLGRALAIELAGQRARMLLADIDLEGAAETARRVAAAGGEAHTTRCDVSKSEDVAALLGEADRAIGGVDLLVNNAGVGCGGDIGVVPLEDWAWVVGINLWGVIYGCHAFVPRFKEQRAGHILNVASIAGLVSAPGLGPYNVTKAGVVALSETLHAELADLGVSVTVLCPSFFRTNIVDRGRAHSKRDIEFAQRQMDRARLQADDVARVALEAVDAGRLYAVPHRDGRWVWRLSRAAPGLVYEAIAPRARRLHRGRQSR